MENHNVARRVCAGLFLAYLGMMVYLLFLQRTPSELPGYNLVPFRTIRQMVFLMEHNTKLKKKRTHQNIKDPTNQKPHKTKKVKIMKHQTN